MSEVSQDTEFPPAKKQKLDDKPQDQDDNDDKKYTLYNTKYSNYVTPEELTKLKEFKVLDEVKAQDDDSNDGDTDSSDDKSEGIPADEIEKMLEEDLPDGYKGVPKPKEKPYVSREKIVLDEKGMNRFEVLPLDWMMVQHYSGMPVYVHRTTRVCTLSKPYFIGKGNARRHDIPITAIPCLAYRKAIEEEEKQKEIDRRIEEQIRNGTWADNIETKDNSSKVNTDNCTQSQNANDINAISNENLTNGENNSGEGGTKNSDLKCPFSNNIVQVEKKENVVDVNNGSYTEVDVKVESTFKEPIPLNIKPVVLPGGIVMPPPKVETVTKSWKAQHLNHEQVNEYCRKLFSFKTVNIMLFKRWADRRKYTKARKALQYPILPEGTKLITIPDCPSAGNENGGGKQMKRDWVMNMDGRSYLSVFHEYVRRALQKQPVYEFKQLENAASPYQATVYIGGMQYGVGVGTSKRQAKSAAARASIHVLIPEMKDELDALAAHSAHHRGPVSASASASASTTASHPDPDFSFFDNVGIEDPRITEFCAATCEPSPHAILRTCLLRNFGDGDRHIHTEMKKLEYQKVQLTMKVGKHTSTVVCKNQKTAKQRASQVILQALHPHVRSWGSLLRLYGSRSVKSRKEKKLEEQQITLLQDKARRNEPNYAVLEKLRDEMSKLREKDDSAMPMRTLLVMEDLPTHSASNLNNVDL